jgi:hypothetical protein
MARRLLAEFLCGLAAAAGAITAFIAALILVAWLG